MVAQQNLKTRTIAIVVPGNSQWRIVQRYLRKITATLNAATPAVMPRWRFLSSKPATFHNGPLCNQPQESSKASLTAGNCFLIFCRITIKLSTPPPNNISVRGSGIGAAT